MIVLITVSNKSIRQPISMYRRNMQTKQSDEIKSPSHYALYAIQPMEFIGRNRIGFIEGNIIKYVARYAMKNGVEDLKKARHYLDKLIEREETGNITLESV